MFPGLIPFVPAIAAAIGGGISYLGQKSANETNLASAAGTTEFNREQAELTRQFNSAEALKGRTFAHEQQVRAMDYAQNLSDTAVQRQMADMRKAGINPILAGRYGGSSTPSAPAPAGPAASASAASGMMGRVESATRGMTASAAQAYRLRYETDKMKQDILLGEENVHTQKQTRMNMRQDYRVKQAQERQIEAQRRNLDVNTALTAGGKTNLTEQQTKASAAQTAAYHRQVEALKTKLEGLREEERIDKSTYGKILRWAGRLNPFSSSAKDMVPVIKGLK